ncbi:MAG: Crp/Fnr family transcriptional regulator [Xanthobacteraceae bacterium]|jgi:CRP/FNR family transcriptional regulator, cyclic AMP receptor protein
MPRISENTSSRRAAAAVGRMAADDGRQLLGQCVLFRELGREERDALFARVHVRAYCAGETIFHMGSAGDSMMAVLSGSVRISVPSPDGREIVLAILQSGEVFGEIALLDGKERTADASAVTACHLAILDRRDVLAFLDRHPKMWPRLAELLCGRLRSSDERVAGLALQQLPTRLAKTLLRFASTKPAATSRQLQVQLSQRELGNICGATRETVNKCLNTWQRRGIVRMDDGAVMIANQTAIEELAEPEPC